MVDDAGAQGKSPANGGVGDENPPSALHPVKNLQIELIELSFAESGGTRHEAEADCTQRNRRHQFQFFRLFDALRQVRGQFPVIVDLLAKGANSVITQRQPELQCTEAPRELKGLLEKREALDRILEQGFCIVAGKGKGLSCGSAIVV